MFMIFIVLHEMHTSLEDDGDIKFKQFRLFEFHVLLGTFVFSGDLKSGQKTDSFGMVQFETIYSKNVY